MKFLIWIILFPALLVSQSQNSSVALTRDTSFTIQSTAEKIRKQFPHARIADPPLPLAASVHENVEYASISGRGLHMDIIVPSGALKNPQPAVILIHGGGWRSGDRSQTMPMARRLADAGYVAVAAEYRLSPEALYPAAVHDLKAAIRFLRAQGTRFRIDTTRIAALGCSAGGQLAALLGTTNNNPAFEGSTGWPEHSSAVQAVVDIDGVLDFNTPDEIGADTIVARTKAASLWFGGTIFEKPHLWTEASPITHVGTRTAPIAFVNSALPRYHFGRDAMIQKLNSLGIYSEVHTIPDTPHPFWFFEPWFDTACRYVTAFLDKTLKTPLRR
jgi:pectinesterase